MNKMLTSIVALGLVLSTIDARADEAGTVSLAMRSAGSGAAAVQLRDDEQVAASAPSSQRTSSTVLRPPSTRRSLSDEQLGLTQDSSFRSAVRMRTAGVVLTAIGLGAAAALGGIAIASAASGSSDGSAVAGFYGAMAGVSAIPAIVGGLLWYNGQQTINSLREERRQKLVPQVSIAAGPSAAALAASWRF